MVLIQVELIRNASGACQGAVSRFLGGCLSFAVPQVSDGHAKPPL
jgi:hypothetical protein